MLKYRKGSDLRGPRSSVFRCGVTIHHAKCGQNMSEHDTSLHHFRELNHIINGQVCALVWGQITTQPSVHLQTFSPPNIYQYVLKG